MTDSGDAVNTETDDRSIRNAPHGQQVVMVGMPAWLAVVLAVGTALSVLFCAMAWNGATRSAERAFQAQQSSAMNREYAVQVFPQLNRLGYPVKTPGEPDHYVAQPEDYAKLDAYIEQRKEPTP